MKIQVQRITLEILREIEVLSDVEGRYIFHLAKIYAPCRHIEEGKFPPKKSYC